MNTEDLFHLIVRNAKNNLGKAKNILKKILTNSKLFDIIICVTRKYP